MSYQDPKDTLRNMYRDPALPQWYRRQAGKAADALEAKDKDVNGLMTLLAKEKAKCERLRAALRLIESPGDITTPEELAYVASEALAAVEGKNDE